MTEETERERYLKDFPPGCVRKEALKQALDIRKFEIELIGRERRISGHLSLCRSQDILRFKKMEI